ncbi:uncharacterized protein LOC129568899 [Sitodiplosis mosellana]|uniref:uncharacterized protein LOC129568899 n=1 Tax=Sitodiplosis mosellana TaxID=263140 RepID=UPI002444C847|nr:uncharacterized protein LOC129568899 [Sitodiplosis mosellana]
MKLPKLKGCSYFCLRVAGLLIGGATVIYFVCDDSVSDNDHSFMGTIEKGSPLERSIKWKLVGLTVYTGWTYGIVMEEAKFLVFVLILWLFATLYSLAHLFFSLVYLIVNISDKDKTMIEDAISSFCGIFLNAALFFILLTVHWLIFKLMQKATVEETDIENAAKNEGNSLLKKAQNVQLNETNNKVLSANP